MYPTLVLSLVAQSLALAGPVTPKSNGQPPTQFISFVKRVQAPLAHLGYVRTFRGQLELVQGMAFSPDGKHLVAGGLGKSLMLWDVETGRILRRYKGHTGNVQCVAFTPDGKHILSGSAFGDSTIRLWDVKTGREIRQYKGHANPGVLYALRVLPSGKQFVSCGYDNSIRFWEIETGKLLRTVSIGPNPTKRTYVVAISPDGRYAILGGQTDRTRLLDLLLEQVVLTLETQTVQAEFTPDGKQFLTSDLQDRTTIWSTAEGQKVLQIDERCAFAPDGERVLTRSGKFLAFPSGQRLFRMDKVRASQFSPNGEYAIDRGDPHVDGHLIKMWRVSSNR